MNAPEITAQMPSTVTITSTVSPGTTSAAAPAGCSTVAIRAETSGCARRIRPNSTSRAATCAGPTSAAAVMAPDALAPTTSSSRGRCAAMPVLTTQVAANTKASNAIAPRGAVFSPMAGAAVSAGGGGGAGGTR